MLQVDITALIGALIAFAGLIAVNIIQAVRSGRNSKQVTDVSNREADTHQREANTREFEVLREGMVAMIEELRTSHNESEVKADRVQKELSGRISTQAGRITTLTSRVGTLEREKSEIIAHLDAVERMVPNPPGAPPRPWNTVTLRTQSPD